MNGRSKSSSARTICLLLGVLCLVFFLAEMNESNSVTGPSSSSAVVSSGPAAAGSSAAAAGGGGGGGAALDVKDGDRPAEAEAMAATESKSFPGGLRRFASFEEYVVSAVKPSDSRLVSSGREWYRCLSTSCLRLFSLLVEVSDNTYVTIPASSFQLRLKNTPKNEEFVVRSLASK